MIETRIRSFVKGIFWELIGLCTLLVLTILTTHNIKQSIALSIIFYSIRITSYYLHERLWGCVKWGIVKMPPKSYIMKMINEWTDLTKKEIKDTKKFIDITMGK